MRNILQSHIREIGALIHKGLHSKAIAASEKLTEQFPDYEDAWMNLFQLYRHLKLSDKAELALNQLINQFGQNESFSIQKVLFLEESGQLAKAIKEAVELSQHLKDRAKLIALLLQFLCKHQRYKEALFLFNKQLELNPSNPELLINCATMHQYLGNLHEADKLSLQALSSNPNYVEAYFFRSHLMKANKDNNHIAKIETLLLDKNLTQTQRAKLYFSLAKEQEDCKEYQASFSARKTGATIYRKLFKYDVKSDLIFIDEIIKNYDQAFLNRPPVGYKNKEPIFIVGLPRSGTTLLERIISNHKNVQSEGELNNFHNEVLRSFKNIESSTKPGENMIAVSKRFDFNKLGERYIQSTRFSTGVSAHFVDKFPQNSLHIGLIHKALPNAKIIILERHPIDLCYAVFKQIFTSIYEYSYDLEELAHYYVHHQKLMKHWQTCLPNSVYTIRYENIINNIEVETRALLNFLALDWDENCLNFYKNKQASSTASSSQVRNKLYSSSIGLWENYAQELSPLIDILEKNQCLDAWQ